jgi:hypothetical protein
MARVATWVAVAYLLVGAAASRAELGHAAPWLPPVVQAATWLGQFHMFNEPRPYASALRIEATRGGMTTRVSAPALYPALRTEGPGYLRSRFLREPSRVARLAADVCARVAPRPDAVRLWLERRARLRAEPAPGDVDLGRYACEP